ncbi:hypothetical protein DSM3645_03408 [Blastopirellula marina DSM 3645]|uniref:Uncharacterized protein n=1 Tax=Blastopirellula marina DSM 3645 TaxID=314230 RepID=A3ZVZ5_9BACT|nr:hypothetical protein DSM3645_03408 [Blastopirellula marina DSM 3645]
MEPPGDANSITTSTASSSITKKMLNWGRKPLGAGSFFGFS